MALVAVANLEEFTGTTRRTFASPLARKVAEQAGFLLSNVEGSGPNNRIQYRDVVAAIARRASADMPRPRHATNSSNSFLRRQMEPTGQHFNPKLAIPHFYIKTDCRIDQVLSLCEKANETSELERLSVFSFVVAATAAALRAVPAVNVSYTDVSLLLHKAVDISIAVPTPSGIKLPVIRNVDLKSQSMNSEIISDLVSRAIRGELDAEECRGGSITIFDLGAYGIREWAGIINPPQCAMLAIGAVEDRVVVQSGRIEMTKALTCVLSADHRAVDGATGAAFLRELTTALENPLALLT